MALGTGFLFNGEYILGAASLCVGAGLFALYETFNVREFRLNEGQISDIAHFAEGVAEKHVDDLRTADSDKWKSLDGDEDTSAENSTDEQ